MQTEVDKQAGLLPGEKRDYVLSCRVKIIEKSYIDEADGEQHQTKMALLIPNLESADAARCMVTYLPDIGTLCMDCGNERIEAFAQKCSKCGSEKIKTEHTELPAFISYPVAAPSRLALLRKNIDCSHHHFIVMSTGAEQDLLKCDGRRIQVRILSLDQEEITDDAKSVNRTVKQ